MKKLWQNRPRAASLVLYALSGVHIAMAAYAFRHGMPFRGWVSATLVVMCWVTGFALAMDREDYKTTERRIKAIDSEKERSEE
jgi:hypothetical protein